MAIQMDLPSIRSGMIELKEQLAGIMPAAAGALIAAEVARVERLNLPEQTLKVGDRAPTFTLPNQKGEMVTMASVLAKGPAIITFYRGAWCPFCNIALRAYQAWLKQFDRFNATLLAISPQTPDRSLATAEEKALTFNVLSDVANSLSRRFHLSFTVDEAARAAYSQLGSHLPDFNGDETWMLPIPATFVVDQKQRVRLAFSSPDPSQRLEPKAILECLEQIAQDR